MSSKPIQPQDKYVLRLPDGMRDELKARAEANNRSLNAEIVLRLQESLFLERSGLITHRTTVADLSSDKPTGQQLVQMIRHLGESLRSMMEQLEEETNRGLLQDAREYVKSERETAGRGSGSKDSGRSE